MNDDDDGPVFPFPSGADPGKTGELGMTLRDYFAAKAMQSILSKWPPVLTEDQDAVCRDTEEIARGAYAAADAMLKARQQ